MHGKYILPLYRICVQCFADVKVVFKTNVFIFASVNFKTLHLLSG